MRGLGGVRRLAAGSGLTDPRKISSLGLWLDASQLSGADGDHLVSTVPWVSLEGNAYTMVQATDANRPLLKLAQQNGLNTVLFDGVNDLLTLPGGALGMGQNMPGLTLLIVLKVLLTTASRQPFGMSTVTAGVNRFGLEANASSGTTLDLRSRRLDGDAADVRTGAAISTSKFVQVTATASYSAGGRALAQNGSPQDAIATLAAGNTTDVASAGIALGGRPDAALWSNCHIGELLLYQRALSASEQASVETYLKRKWGIA